MIRSGEPYVRTFFARINVLANKRYKRLINNMEFALDS